MRKYLYGILFIAPLVIMGSVGVSGLNAEDVKTSTPFNQTLDGSSSTFRSHDHSFKINVDTDEQKALQDATVVPDTDVKSVETNEGATVVPDKVDNATDVKTDVVPDKTDVHPEVKVDK